MSNQLSSLTNAGAGVTGKEIQTSTSEHYVHVSAATWGGQSVKLQIKNDNAGTWHDIAGAIFTANGDQRLAVGNGQTVRAITTGSGGTMAGVNVFFVPHYH
jgi:hypothetical protein